MRHWWHILIGAALLSCSLGASAHHSYSQWSADLATVNGTVKDFQWTNPHIWIQVMVEDADHQVTEWGFESAAPGMLHRFGWKVSSVKAGDKVTVTYHPKRDGAKLGSLVKIVLPDLSVLEVRDLVIMPPPQEPGGLTGDSPAGSAPPPANPPPARP